MKAIGRLGQLVAPLVIEEFTNVGIVRIAGTDHPKPLQRIP